MQVDKGKYSWESAGRLIKIRKLKKFTQVGMARRLDTSVNAYRKNEKGKNFLNFKSLEILAAELGIAMDWYMFNRGPMFFKDSAQLETQIKELQTQLEEAKQGGRTGGPGHAGLPAEVNQLVEAMQRVPQLFHEVMAYFFQFKKAHPELFESKPALEP
jgi:transcriptional regulator with XRE-family HTH domain